MTKAELVARIANETGLTREEVLAVVEKFMDDVKDVVASGENIYLRGFGSFGRKHRAEKIARNITKNTTVVVPAHDIASFKPSPDFDKMLLN